MGISMSRIALSTLLAVSLGSLACVGDAPTFSGEPTPDADVGELTPEEEVRLQFETDVAPLLTSFCSACHGSATTVPFMEDGNAMYSSVMEWPNLISLKVPGASSLLSKGAHSGPAWQPDQATTVRSWIDAEALLAPDDENALETTPFVPVAGDNVIDLGPIGLVGATITFKMEPLSTSMYISRLSLNAAAEGVHIVHPTFIPWDGDSPRPDPVDRFSNVDMYAGATESVTVGGGTLILVNVDPTSPISVRFATAELSDAGNTVLEGCNAVGAFTANAQAPLSQACVSCHGGNNGGATAATDMTLINDLSPEGQLAACGQILSRVNLADPNNSSIFLAAEPGSALGHPFKFNNNIGNFEAYRAALNVWISAEQAAAPQP
jgi:mono/diheme cytochrome c family protein